MSIKKQKLKNRVANGSGTLEFYPDFGCLKINNNQMRIDRKVNLKKGKPFTITKLGSKPSSKADVYNEIDVTRKQDKKKFRNAKELENCRTARSSSADSVKNKDRESVWKEVVRTRSMSPTPATPPLNADLPLRKFYSYSTKIAEQLEIVKIFINHQTEMADSLYDINRQRKRATEFAVRFSRNNLYQMKRLVKQIKEIIVPYPFDNMAKSDSELLCKKILLAYQSATQALQSYLNYMKNSQSIDVPEKIRELILLIADLYLCCEHLSLPWEQIDILTLCKQLIVLLDVKIAESLGKTPVVGSTGEVKCADKEDKRFSMYKTKLTNSSWKKKTEALAKIKFGVPKLSCLLKMKKEAKTTLPKSTLEIYSCKTNDPVTNHRQSQTATDNPEKESKRSNAEKTTLFKKYRSTPREVTSQDDDIETVVQSIKGEESGQANRGAHELTEALSSYCQDEGIDCLNKNEMKNLVLKTIQELQRSAKSDVKNSLNNLFKSLDFQPKVPPPRNVKVVHIISHEPIPEETEEEICEDKKPEEKVNFGELSAEDSTEPKSMTPKHRKLNNVFKPISAPSSHSADASNGIVDLEVTQKWAEVFVHYKKMLNEYRRNNVMYKKGIPVRPCELVLRISDQIIDDTISKISSGMESDHILKQLYYNELLEVL